MNTMYEYNSLGLLAVSDYPVMSHNIIKSINLYVENVKKTLNVSRRKDGPYSPAEFITKVMQYKVCRHTLQPNCQANVDKV
jgi:hypothetical protein